MSTRGSQEVFIWIPRKLNISYRILIDEVDVTDDIVKAEFEKTVTDGVGKFSFELINTDGSYNDKYTGGEIVKLYITRDGTETLRYLGLIDVVEQKFDRAYFLTVKGSHYSEKLLDITITRTFEDTQISGTSDSILNTIIADANSKLSESFTTTNVATNTTKATINWSQKPFWDCIKDLCEIAGYDFYVDDNKDCHFFEEFTQTNPDEAIVWNDNLIKIEGIGTDTKDVKNKVIVYGEDNSGLEIVYTAMDSSASLNVKEKIVKDKSITTLQQAKERANAELELLKTPQKRGTAKSLLLPSLRPGDFIWISNPTQSIHQQFKIYKFKHKFPELQTKSTIQTKKHIPSLFRKHTEKELSLEDVVNENDLDYSVNETFDADSGTHTNTLILDGKLQLQSGSSNGTWISEVYDADTTDNIQYYELKISGQDLAQTEVKISVDGGLNWEPAVGTVYTGTKYSTSNAGKKLRIKFNFHIDSFNPNPQVEGFSILYS